MQGPGGLAVVGAQQSKLAVGLLQRDLAGDPLGQLALGPLHANLTGIEFDLDATGQGDGLFSDAGHDYQTSQSTSPPTSASRAALSDSTPREVDSTAMPMPLRTRGTSSLPT